MNHVRLRRLGGIPSLLMVLAVLIAGQPAHAAGTFTGTVFRDFDADGVDDGALEPGVGGVTVSAFDSGGAPAGSTTTCSATGVPGAVCTLSNLGFFELVVAGTGPYRIEFSGVPLAYASGPFGGGSGTSVQFLADPGGGTTGNVDLGVNNPAHYCQADALIATPTFVNGDPLTTPPGACPDGGSPASDFFALVSFLNTADSNNAAGVNFIAQGEELGTTWGVAWQASSSSLYLSALVKRHCGLGPLPVGSAGSRTGVIYRVTGDFTVNPTVDPWFNLDDITGVSTGAEPASRGLDPCTTQPNYDPNAFDATGKVGLGDLDISDDGSTLWVVNLFDRTLYELAIGDPPLVPGDADVTAHPFGAAEPACTSGVFRPWAVKFYNGLVYVGGVCTGENGGTGGDLTAHVLSHDPAGAVGNFTPVFQMDLDYPRGKVSDQGANEPLATWRPWIDQWSDITGPAPDGGPFGQTLFPQPILADLEFDIDGALLLGFLDRAGNQLGNDNFQTDGVDTEVFEGVIAGDLLRVCFDPDDTDANGNPFVLEADADCPDPGGPTVAADQVPPQGPGGREYYWTDYYRWDNDPTSPNGGTHQEITLGGLVHRFGSGEIGASAFDPYDDFRAGGVVWLSNAAGTRAHSLEVFGQDEGGQPATFGKAAGAGDLELLCDPAPLELGNRLWCDDGDGAQEGGEPVAPGVTVVLVCGTANPVSDVTDAAGQYLFTDAAYQVANGTPIPRNATCTVSIDTVANAAALAAACGGPVGPTPPNTGAGGNPDLNDSDCTDAGGGIVQVPVSTGGSGANDHTIDCGFRGAVHDFGDAPDPTYPVLLASNGARHIVLGQGNPTLGAVVDVEPDGQPTASHTGDDANGVPDDEDGVTLPAFTPGSNAVIQLQGGPTGGLVDAWIDWNGNGSWADAGEQVATNFAVGAGASVPLAVAVPVGATPGPTCTRFRISTAGGLTPTGEAPDGEVEDHLGTIGQLEDWGDLPDTGAGSGTGNYSTQAADGGPSHPIVAGLALGTNEDGESDGQQSVGADGDDLAGAPDDEDGVDPGELVLGIGDPAVIDVAVTNTTAGSANVCGFIDWNGDGDFGDASEAAGPVAAAASGTVQLNFGNVPVGAVAATYARFRLSTDAGCSPVGAATDGEVEDYPAVVGAGPPQEIPTVDSVGLVLLSLLLMGAAVRTLLARRRAS